MSEIPNPQFEILRARFPEAYAAVKKAAAPADGDYVCAPARDQGHSVIRRFSDGRTHRVHSVFDPVIEPDKILARQDVTPGSLIVLLGIGIGYPLLRAVERWAGQRVTILALERDPALLKLGLDIEDLRPALLDERVILKVGPDVKHFSDEEARRLDGFSHRHVRLFNLPGPYQLFLDDYNEAVQQLMALLPPGNRVSVVGLSGASPDLIDQMVADGHMKTLQAIMENGATAQLRSPLPVNVETAWTTISTGMNPGHTGVFGFPSPPYPADTDSASSPERLWHIANRHGKRAGILNVPLTDHQDPVDGWLVTTGAPLRSYPSEIIGELIRNLPDNIDAPKRVLNWSSKCIGAFLGDANRANSLKYLSETHPVDLQITVFDFMREIQQHYWYCADPSHPAHNPAHTQILGDVLTHAYETADALVSSVIMEMKQGDVLFVVSDFSYCPSAGTFHINRFLEEKGYLVMNGAAPDWERARAWAVSDSGGACAGILINLRGRDPRGIVAPGAEYDELRDAIARELLAERDPQTNAAIIEAVLRREDIFTGPRADAAPDLIALSTYRLDSAFEASGLLSRPLPPGPATTIQPQDFTAVPAPFGILVAIGKTIRSGVRLKNIDAVDVAPAILHALKLPAPEHLQGRIPPLFSDLVY